MFIFHWSLTLQTTLRRLNFHFCLKLMLHAYFESFVNKLRLPCIIFLYKTENYMGSNVKVHLICAVLMHLKNEWIMKAWMYLLNSLLFLDTSLIVNGYLLLKASKRQTKLTSLLCVCQTNEQIPIKVDLVKGLFLPRTSVSPCPTLVPWALNRQFLAFPIFYLVINQGGNRQKFKSLTLDEWGAQRNCKAFFCFVWKT